MPAKPSPRRSSTMPAAKVSGARDAAADSAASAGASSALSSSQKGSSSPSTRSEPGSVGQRARRITRGSTLPFQRFRSRRSAMSCGSSAAGASAFGGEPNATPREFLPPAVTSVKRECWRSSPMAVTRSKRAAGTSSVGCGLPIPNGRSSSRSSARARPSSPPGTTASTRSTGIRSSGDSAAAACAASARRKGSTAAASSSTPAAMRWPPKRTSCPEQAARPACRSYAEMLRPEPRPPPSPSSAITTHGRRQRSTSRDATIPTTPGCQPSPATTIAPSCACGAQAASAANRMRVSASRRSRLRRSSSRATSPARAASSVRSSSRAASARCMRPAALMRGPRRNPSECSESSPGATAPTSIRARRPGLRVRPSATTPSRTMRRFSPRSGTRSQTVASAASSMSSSASAGSRPAALNRAWLSFSTTPDAHSSGQP